MTLLYAGQAQHKAGRAEALHQAMRQLLDDPRHPTFANHFFWAPLVVVSEGN